MIKRYNETVFGDIIVTWWTDDEDRIGMTMTPLSMKDKGVFSAETIESLVQLHARGDHLANGYGNGITLATTSATDRMHLVSQTSDERSVTTVLEDDTGRRVEHRLIADEGCEALRASVCFENRGDKPVTLDLLSSLNFGGITPFTEGDACNELLLHRACSFWSGEGRFKTETIEEAMLERSWTGHALRIVKFGQVGSMPVRGYFPYAAIEDKANDVTWAIQLACPSSWQIEIRRKDDKLNMMASLADEDFGHWAKTIAPGESFVTPEAYVTVGCGGVDAVSQRLLSIHRKNMPHPDADLPVLFNEYCTTWGEPSHKNLEKIADHLKGHGIDYLVIDAGWYGGREGCVWYNCGGDWIPDEKTLFPDGLKATAEMIHSKGMVPGLWFEPETCAEDSEIFKKEDMLLKRNGCVIDTDNRHFLDLRKEEVRTYLDERVTGLLKKCGFGYVKIDYNDCIGVGCDDEDSLGEGLRANMQETLAFFRRMRENIPDLIIENCASGGHRLEPSLMAVSDMASFSDAHECLEIPIIAASLHRLILPAQSQIWAVLRAKDDLRRINYSIVNTFLGVMCLSGDIYDLNDEQWKKVDEGIEFYRMIRHLIRDGISEFHGNVSASWRHPEGWQAICRHYAGETLSVIHTFGGEHPDKITLPVRGSQIRSIMCSEENRVTLEDGLLTVELKVPFEAVAVYTAG
ncbi:MAG: alpha-galactosidase [Lachnospiraceae bacterium]|nr:alpha-galactosidase [Lachnospiraceae bacterium]